MNSFSLLVLTLISFNGYISCYDITDCGSDDGKVDSLSFTNCSDSDSACTLKRGTTPTIDVKFTPTVDSKTAIIKVWGIIAGSPVAFHINPENTCDAWGVKCPLAKGVSNEMKVTMPISSSYPKIKFEIKLELVDDDGKNIFCKRFPAIIE